MSLTVSLSLSITTDRTTLTLSDSTVYGTRSNYYVFIDAYKVDQFNNKTALTVTNNLSPNTVTSWTIPYDVVQGDGWVQILYVAPQAWNSGTTYAANDAVYYIPNGLVYTSVGAGNINNLPTNATFWTPVPDPASLASRKGQSNQSNNLDSLVYDRILSYNGQYFFATMFQEMATGTDSNNQAVLATYDLFSLWLDAMAICDSRVQTIVGEQIARSIQSTYINQPVVFSTSTN